MDGDARTMDLDIAYCIVDVFSERPLAGNALCVVLDPVPEPVMQALAREVNLSETTFPVVTADGEYENRIFTPRTELPFAGHPSLGTAWSLGAGHWIQRTSGATVVIDVDGTGAVMSQPDPEFTEVDASPAAKALGLSAYDGAWVAGAGGNRHLITLTDVPIHRLDPNFAAVDSAARAVGTFSVAVVERRTDSRLHVRVFVPSAGVPEDPGTGSVAGPAALLARRQWGTDVDVRIEQGAEIGRPCIIEVHAEPGALQVGGRVAQCAKGHFSL
jgi:trans-2,3-dihydro-3-hydroxyanthranilate isomerase